MNFSNFEPVLTNFQFFLYFMYLLIHTWIPQQISKNKHSRSFPNLKSLEVHFWFHCEFFLSESNDNPYHHVFRANDYDLLAIGWLTEEFGFSVLGPSKLIFPIFLNFGQFLLIFHSGANWIVLQNFEKSTKMAKILGEKILFNQ